MKMKKTSTLKPLDIGRKLLTEAEFSELLAGYQPSKLSSDDSSSSASEPSLTQASIDIQGSYILMPRSNNYARGVHVLQETCQQEGNQNHPQYVRSDGSRIYRPLTFKENLQARVEDYETLTDEQGNERSLDDRMRFFNTRLDSCCGIAYKDKSTKFKLVPICEELITIDRDISNNDFDGASLPIDYDSLQGVELDFEKAKYQEYLTKGEVLENPGWLAAVENDKVLLKTYADIVFNENFNKFGKDNYGFGAMGFLPLPPYKKNCLRTLYLHPGNDDSCVAASGIYLKIVAGSFLRIAP